MPLSSNSRRSFSNDATVLWDIIQPLTHSLTSFEKTDINNILSFRHEGF